MVAVIYTAGVICYHGFADPFEKGLENDDQVCFILAHEQQTDSRRATVS